MSVDYKIIEGGLKRRDPELDLPDPDLFDEDTIIETIDGTRWVCRFDYSSIEDSEAGRAKRDSWYLWRRVDKDYRT